MCRWRYGPVRTSELVSQLLQSRAPSTSGRYLKEIGKFVSWCKAGKVSSLPPLSVTLALAYMVKVFNQSKSVPAHSALKWYHSFLPFGHQNPFDSAMLQNCPIQDVENCSRNAWTTSAMTAVSSAYTAYVQLEQRQRSGTTAAVRNNDNLSERTLKVHGRWKTSYAKDMYILDDVEERLKVSSSKGLQ